MGITAVAFDFGGVLAAPPMTGLDAYATELGLPASAFRPFFRGDPMMGALETGALSGRDFFKYVCTEAQARYGVRVDIRMLAAAAAQGEVLNEGMIDLVSEVRERYGTALLTNNVREATWRATFPFELFDVVVDSSEVGSRKPDPVIYEVLLERLGRPPHEVAFIDDFAENLLPAATLGLATIAFVNEQQCRRDLARLGVVAVPAR